MSWRETIRQAPVVLKIGYPAFVLALAISVASTFTGNRLYSLPVGLVAVGLGLALALDLGSAASGLALIMRTQKVMGIDYSRSIFATRWYARAFGVLMMVVGIGFVVVSLGGR